MKASEASAKPAWQTDELEDEWIDLEEENASTEQQATGSPAQTTSDLSLTQIHGSILAPSEVLHESSASSVSVAGTVLIREDMPAVPILPQTPRRNIQVPEGLVDFASL